MKYFGKDPFEKYNNNVITFLKSKIYIYIVKFEFCKEIRCSHKFETSKCIASLKTL